MPRASGHSPDWTTGTMTRAEPEGPRGGAVDIQLEGPSVHPTAWVEPHVARCDSGICRWPGLLLGQSYGTRASQLRGNEAACVTALVHRPMPAAW